MLLFTRLIALAPLALAACLSPQTPDAGQADREEGGHICPYDPADEAAPDEAAADSGGPPAHAHAHDRHQDLDGDGNCGGGNNPDGDPDNPGKAHRH